MPHYMITRRREPGKRVRQLFRIESLLFTLLMIPAGNHALANNDVFLGSNNGFSLYMGKPTRSGNQGSFIQFDEITKYRHPRYLQSLLPPYDRRFYQLIRKSLVIDCDRQLIGMLGMTWLGKDGEIIKRYQSRHLELFPIPANSISEIELKHACGTRQSGNHILTK